MRGGLMSYKYPWLDNINLLIREFYFGGVAQLVRAEES